MFGFTALRNKRSNATGLLTRYIHPHAHPQGVQSGCVSQNGVVYCPTSFMNPVNFGATFNDSHVLTMGAFIAEETRALWLAGAGEESLWSGRPHIGLDLWSPNINIGSFASPLFSSSAAHCSLSLPYPLPLQRATRAGAATSRWRPRTP